MTFTLKLDDGNGELAEAKSSVFFQYIAPVVNNSGSSNTGDNFEYGRTKLKIVKIDEVGLIELRALEDSEFDLKAIRNESGTHARRLNDLISHTRQHLELWLEKANGTKYLLPYSETKEMNETTQGIWFIKEELFKPSSKKIMVQVLWWNVYSISAYKGN